MIMKVVIIEDERLTAKRLEGLLLRYEPTIRVLAQLPSVEEAVDWFSTVEAAEEKPDLVFMDIHLEDGLAFRIIEQTRLSTPIIFTTAYDEYMIKAFKLNSVDYLLKPVNYDDLVAAIEKFKSFREIFGSTVPEPEAKPVQTPDMDALLKLLAQPRETSYKDRFMITIGTRIRSVGVGEIAYFFLEEKMAFLVTRDGANLPVDYTLDKLTQLLDPRQFFRVSRQFLVSLPAIQAIHTYSAGKLKLDLTPKARHEVFVSGDRISDFKEWLGK